MDLHDKLTTAEHTSLPVENEPTKSSQTKATRDATKENSMIALSVH